MQSPSENYRAAAAVGKQRDASTNQSNNLSRHTSRTFCVCDRSNIPRYELVTMKLNWQSAAEYCRDRTSQLVAIAKKRRTRCPSSVSDAYTGSGTAENFWYQSSILIPRCYSGICCRPSVCLSVCPSVTSRYCIETTGRIELGFGMEASSQLSHTVRKFGYLLKLRYFPLELCF